MRITEMTPHTSPVSPAGLYSMTQAKPAQLGQDERKSTLTADVAVLSGAALIAVGLSVANMMSLYYWGKGVGTKNKKLRNRAIGVFVGTYVAPFLLLPFVMGSAERIESRFQFKRQYAQAPEDAPTYIDPALSQQKEY